MAMEQRRDDAVDGGLLHSAAGADTDDFKKAADIFISPDGHAVRYLVQTELNPFSTAGDGSGQFDHRHRPGRPTEHHAGGRVRYRWPDIPVGLRDTRDYYNHDIRFIVIVTVIVVLLILMLLLRAIVAPLYLIASVIVSYLSALGIGVIVFQVHPRPGIALERSRMAFIVLVAVGADYNMLLISRIRDESAAGMRSGVIRTVGSTGGVITAAGLIFAASMFGLLFASIAIMVQAGFIIGIGILLDTFLVRTITVPAIAVLVGRANWWPSDGPRRQRGDSRKRHHRRSGDQARRLRATHRNRHRAHPPPRVTNPTLSQPVADGGSSDEICVGMLWNSWRRRALRRCRPGAAAPRARSAHGGPARPGWLRRVGWACGGRLRAGLAGSWTRRATFAPQLLEDPGSDQGCAREARSTSAEGWAEMSTTLTSLADGADLLFTGMIYQGLAANVAEYYDIPLAALHYFPMRANGQLLPFLPSPLIRSAMTVFGWLDWRMTKEAEDAQRRELGLPKATGPSTRRIAERGSLEIQAYDEVCFPGLAAEWAKWDGRRPFVGALTMELPTDADDEVASWIAAGTPPIYFGFGSMPVESPADTVAMIGAACAQLGERALICAGASDFSRRPPFRPRQGGGRGEPRGHLSRPAARSSTTVARAPRPRACAPESPR